MELRRATLLSRVGAAVKSWRIRAGFSQERLASLLDVSVRTIVRLEDGEHDPRYTMLIMMEKCAPGLFAGLTLVRRGILPVPHRRRRATTRIAAPRRPAGTRRR